MGDDEPGSAFVLRLLVASAAVRLTPHVRCHPDPRPPSSRATPRPPPSCSRSSTTSCGSSPRRSWPQEKPGQTLQATALVHEAYLRLVGEAAPDWDGRGHFFAAAAEAMRRILVEHARRKRPAQARRRTASGSTWTRLPAPRPPPGRRPAGPRRGPGRAGPRGAGQGGAGQAPLLRRADHAPRPPPASGSRPATADRHWAVRPGLAVRRVGDAGGLTTVRIRDPRRAAGATYADLLEGGPRSTPIMSPASASGLYARRPRERGLDSVTLARSPFRRTHGSAAGTDHRDASPILDTIFAAAWSWRPPKTGPRFSPAPAGPMRPCESGWKYWSPPTFGPAGSWTARPRAGRRSIRPSRRAPARSSGRTG